MAGPAGKDFVFPWGKYKGKDVACVSIEDPLYILRNHDDDVIYFTDDVIYPLRARCNDQISKLPKLPEN